MHCNGIFTYVLYIAEDMLEALRDILKKKEEIISFCNQNILQQIAIKRIVFAYLFFQAFISVQLCSTIICTERILVELSGLSWPVLQPPS